MAGTVYLKTNRFDIKLEAITFKTKDFESLCRTDFLFPEGKIWDHPPIVGLDVMRHPRDPSVLLVLLCFGVGCVILRFKSGEELTVRIRNFLSDNRIHFVGFGIPEKKDLFPFQELWLTKCEVDIGYLAARILKDSKYKRCELSELARKILGIKRMVGLTDATSFERHEQIKCAICQLFITSVIAMGLMGANDKKSLECSPKKSSFFKNLNSFHLLAEGLFKLPKSKKKSQSPKTEKVEHMLGYNVPECRDIPFLIHDFGDGSSHDKIKKKTTDHLEKESSDDMNEESCRTKTRLKGILKCPAAGYQCNLSPPEKASTPSTSNELTDSQRRLKRANSKGCNVSFKCH
ncbi:hypothetical protein F511_01901 [Dorcoceras hygrometricum]|uniref:3'-5' exonuclease domain-containing protein n=1 Tax=Dorcoceras hygrometricum TaxID=472368 RepID=A0A2Z7D2K6_9LAMI|nr:hypothetical protein F511_01901 [Dorcoceras hygrometricum]